MNFQNLFKIAIKALGNNKMRCFLTMLGVIIGVGAVIAMLAIGQGSKNSIKEQISEMGSNMIMIMPGAERRGGVRQSSEDMQTLKPADYEAIVNQASGIAYSTPTVSSSGQWVYGNNNYPSQAQGVNTEFLKIRQRNVAEGEMFTENDVKTAAKVCVLGKTLVNNLFPDGSDPIGKVVRFGSIPLTVIGVLDEKGYNTMGQDQDDLALVPYTTVMKRMLAIDYLQGITLSAENEDQTEMLIDEISDILRTSHKLRDGEADNFSIRSMKELAEMISSTSSMMTVLLAAVAGISLLVGGIGIMNIMIVSVTERTREIGLRMSIGATGRDIMTQFLIEAIIISVTGGIIGILLGALATWMIKIFVNWPVQIDPGSVILSFVVCTIIGIIFGFYPAAKASNLDPIEAIRYE
ncbi:MAG: FtsX-like permease family protein [Bacteroidales bacterium]|nr:FtsX-like permease family protein [Bacteroidales bacterium]MBD5206321.1 FtsX-like permease family protein [Bacteroidales bacterium]MBD5349066.1 FtsX-like permease family protein [Bacteroides sp.]